MFAILLSKELDPFYQNIGSFPTVIFTFFLVICVFYWLVAVLGWIDIDILDFDVPDVDLGVDSDLTTPNVLAGLMMRLGLNGVPVTVIVSLIALIGWIICYYIVHFLFGLVPDGLLRYLVGLPVFIGCLYIAALITSVLIKPLRPLFKNAQVQAVKHILGQTAVVRTSKIDNDFGEVMLADGGAGLILKARTFGDVSFKKGEKVVLLEYIEADDVYRVISEEEFSN